MLVQILIDAKRDDRQFEPPFLTVQDWIHRRAASGNCTWMCGDADMEVLTQSEMSAEPDFGHRLRQLRWFRRTFASCVQTLDKRYGLRTSVDDQVLARVFVDWVETIEEKKRLAHVDRADFIKFSGGLMLRELIKSHPAIVQLPSHPTTVVPETVSFWPEGFLYTNFCISAVCAVHLQEMGEALELSDSVDDLRTWWSFRENTHEIPAYAISFLDRFFGVEPNWATPDLPEARAAMAEAPTSKVLAGSKGKLGAR